MNRTRLSAFAHKHDIEAVVATSTENLRYCVGYELFESAWNYFQAAVVIPIQQDLPMTVILPSFEAGFAVDAGLDQRANILLFGGQIGHVARDLGLDEVFEKLGRSVHETIEAGIVAALSTAGITKGRVAIEGRGDILTNLRAVDKTRNYIDKGEDLLFWARLVKTTEEIERLRRAAAINEAGIQAAIGMASSLSIRDVGRLFATIVQSAGGQVMHLIFDDIGVYRHWGTGASRRRSGGANDHENYPIPRGTRACYDAGVLVDSYVSDLGGTFFVGSKLQPADVAIYEALSAGIEMGIQSARAGIRASDFYDGVMATIRAAGLSNYSLPNVGHGIGVEHVEGILSRPVTVVSPFLPSPFDMELEAGMVINVEVPLFVEREGGFQYELTCLVTDTEAELLSNRRGLELV